ncbi:hypothetical protein ALC57_16179 [Trachymyrmex cornetzi]|uniref:Uncharacterized protein n=1 Tax=Trachymyrmex cornetzi TaxID=471704 RepID=A0A195DFF5_9HYME|nr:hypothetical protein ALC57_16179 [Trachymyrmex cornetzi]
MAMSQEGFFAFSTYKMLHMPMFAKCRYHAFFDGTSTGTTNWDSHFIVTPQTIELVLRNIQLIIKTESNSRSRTDFSGFGIEFYTTSCTIEMIRMIKFTTKS